MVEAYAQQETDCGYWLIKGPKQEEAWKFRTLERFIARDDVEQGSRSGCRRATNSPTIAGALRSDLKT